MEIARHPSHCFDSARKLRQPAGRAVWSSLTTIRKVASAILFIGLLASCATNQLHHDGLAAIDAGRYVEGIAMLEKAAQENPGNTSFRLDLKARREASVQQLIAAADNARRAGELDKAERLYHDVLSIENGNSRAERGIEGVAADRHHADLVEQANTAFAGGDLALADAKLRAVLAEDPGYAAARSLQVKIDDAREPVNVVPRLHPRDNRPVTLQFRDANTKMVFEVLSRQTGINFVFDKDVRSDGKTTIFVEQVPVEQAIELILGQNQLGRQVLSENMVMIYPNTPQKQKDYQDQIVKTIYLTNANPTQAQSMLKTVLDVKTLFIDERANVIMIRDTPETVRMAEKLLASIDLPEPEVMIEVEVLEITRSRLQQLGINYPTSLAYSMTAPDGGDFHVSDYDKQNSDTITATPLSVSVDVLKQVGLTNLLASPRIRARNKEKAKILIGSRVPVITNSVTPTSSGAAVVTGNVQYLDVGLTLGVEPTIYLDSEVAIKFDFEISTIVKEVRSSGGTDGNGTLAYEIGTRNASTLLRLKDGETQILAGLIQDRDTQNSSHIPGLGDMPVLGRLFGSKRDSNDKTEIVLSITPRIIRSQPRASSENTEFWYGTESSNRSAPLGVASAPNASTRDAGAAVELSALNASGRAVDSANGPESADAPVLTAPPSRAPAAGVQGLSGVSLDGPAATGVGDEFAVTVRLSGSDPLKSVRAQVRYDPSVLLLQSAEAGDVVPGELQASAIPRINQIAGVVQFVVSATPENPVSGDGGLLVLHFKATAPNAASKISLQLSAVNASGVSMPPANQEPLTLAVNQ
jgi:general secretion pathway protein D